MTEFAVLWRRAVFEQQSAQGLSKAKAGTREFEERLQHLAAVDAVVKEILEDHIEMVDLEIQTRKGGRWQVLHLKHDTTSLKIPFPKLGEDLQIQVRKIMETNQISIRGNEDKFKSMLETGKLAYAEITLGWLGVFEIISSFTGAFGSMKHQQAEIIRAAADGDERAREILRLTVEFDSFNGQWPAKLEFSQDSVSLSSYSQERKLTVKSVDDHYVVTIDCRHSPSQSAMSRVLKAVAGLVLEHYVPDMTIVLETDGVETTYSHQNPQVEVIQEPEAPEVRQRTVAEIVEMIQDTGVEPVYTLHDNLSPAQVEITWVVEDEETASSLSVFVKTSGLYQWVGTKTLGSSIQLPKSLLGFYLQDASKKRRQTVLDVRVETEEL